MFIDHLTTKCTTQKRYLLSYDSFGTYCNFDLIFQLSYVNIVLNFPKKKYTIQVMDKTHLRKKFEATTNHLILILNIHPFN